MHDRGASMKIIKRILSLLIILTLTVAYFPAAADNVSNVFYLHTVELFRSDDLTITAGGTIRKDSETFFIPVTVVNISEKKFMLSFSRNQLLNGRYVYGAMNCPSLMQPGETRQFDLYVYRSVLAEYGMTTLNQIASLEAEVIGDSPSGTCQVFGTVMLSASLLGLSSRKAPPVPYSDELEQQFLFEGDGLAIWLDGFSPDGSMLNLCMTNNRSEPAIAEVENIIINGWQMPYSMQLNTTPGRTDWLQLELGSNIPDYSGLASVAFDLYLMSRDAQASLERGEEYYSRLYDEPVHISLVPAHPAVVPEPEGWTLAAEQDGLQILYRDGFSRSKSNVVLPLLIINTSEQAVCPYTGGTLQVNGQPINTEGFLENLYLVGPGAKSAPTLYIRNKLLSNVGIKWNEIHSVDFDLLLSPYGLFEESEGWRTFPVHISLD